VEGLIWLLRIPGAELALLATGIGVGGVLLGLWLTGAGRRARMVVPFSAGVLLGVVVFGLLPELVVEGGWPPTALLFGGGYGLLWLINRHVAPVCPTCAHDHDHLACETLLHGFAVPLISASALHSFFDGWSIASAQMAAPLAVRVAVPLAVALHKIPEGIALGGILRASMKSRWAALGWGALAELATLAGGMVSVAIAPRLGSAWITYPLGIAAGWLFFLGAHAIHQEWKRRGPLPAFTTAMAGAVGAAALQQGVQFWLR
jgi:zinc transporter ZupT